MINNFSFSEQAIPQGNPLASASDFSLLALTGWDSREFSFDSEEFSQDSSLTNALGIYTIDCVNTQSKSSTLEVKIFGELNIRVFLDTFFFQLDPNPSKNLPIKSVEVENTSCEVDPVRLEATIGLVIKALLHKVCL